MRCALRCERARLSFSRLAVAAADFLRFFRSRGTTHAACIKWRSLSRQSSRFRRCSRVRLLDSTSSPASFIRLPNRLAIRRFTTSGSAAEAATFQRRVALEFTLLTFCPPGPGLRENLKSISPRGIRIWSLTTRCFDTAFNPTVKLRLSNMGSRQFRPTRLSLVWLVLVDVLIEGLKRIDDELFVVQRFDLASQQFNVKRAIEASLL